MILLIDLPEEPHHVIGRGTVKCAGRLIGEEKAGAGDEGSGDGDALLLSAGHLVWQVVLPGEQPHAVEILLGELHPLAGADTLVVKRQGDVLQRGLEGDEVEGLEDKTDLMSPKLRCLVLPRAGDQLPIQSVGAGIVGVEDAEDIE